MYYEWYLKISLENIYPALELINPFFAFDQ